MPALYEVVATTLRRHSYEDLAKGKSVMSVECAVGRMLSLVSCPAINIALLVAQIAASFFHLQFDASTLSRVAHRARHASRGSSTDDACSQSLPWEDLLGHADLVLL